MKRLLNPFTISLFGLFVIAAISLVYADEPTEYDPVALTVQVIEGPYPGTVAVNDLDITFTAGEITAASCNSFISTGKELLYMRNASAVTDATVTLFSVLDQYKRKSDIDYTIGASEYSAFWFGATAGWRNATQTIYIRAATSNVEFAVIRIAN